MSKNTFIFISFIILIWLLALPFMANGQVSLLSFCEEVSRELIKGYDQKGIELVHNPHLRLAMSVIIEASMKKRTYLSIEFESNIEALLWYGKHFSIIERSELKQLIKEHELQMTDLVDQKTVKRLGKVKGVDALVLGNYTVEPAALTLRCRIVAVETADLLSSVIKRIPFEDLYPVRRNTLGQQGKKLLPEEQQNEPSVEVFRLNFWYETLDTSGQPIRQPIGQIVKSGEQVNIVAETDVDAHVYAFTIDTDYEIFPVFVTDTGEPIKLEAGEPRRIGGSVSGTLGTERFYAIADTEDFTTDEIQPIIEKEVQYLKSQDGKKDWRPLRTRNLLGLPEHFVQANFWFEHIRK